MSYQPLDQTSSVYVPHDDLLPDSRHGKLVLRRENDVVGVVELLADVSHSIWELQCNAPAGIFVFTSVCEMCLKIKVSAPLKVTLARDAPRSSNQQQKFVSKSLKDFYFSS